MDAEKLNQALYDKMAAEQERFKHGLLGLTTEEALNHAYEDVCCKGEFQNPNTTRLRLISGRWTGSHRKGGKSSIFVRFHSEFLRGAMAKP